MKIRGVFVFVIVVFVIMVIVGCTEISKGEMAKASVSGKVMKEIGVNRNARVVIEFREKNKLTASDEVKIGRQEVVDELGGKVKREFAYSTSVSAEVTREDVLKLVENPDVVNIREEKIFYATLADSVPLINASYTWALQQNSFNLTGLNQTVCVIDTGVNYNHVDLGGCFGNNNASSTCKVIGGYDFVNSDSDPMDDNGHGTHVAGIVAANNTILGVAPNAKIVALKALNSAGNGGDPAVAASIDWCVGNSSRYNIKVITMSLGDNLNYSNYCDSEYSLVATSINAAVAKNITVVISSGNNGNSNGISGPSCIENATPVGSTDKDDSVSSFSNRNSLLKLMAPGGSITSTDIGGGHSIKSGTSMAAPHVAGAIAIMNQYLQLVNRTRNPDQIETSLNNTGKRIPDNSNGLNFTRINLYNAIISLDSDLPNVTLISPANNSYSIINNQTFRCNASDLSLKNVSVYIWNSTKGIYNLTTYTVSSGFNSAEINMTNISLGSYEWNCRYGDENNNYAFARTNNTFTITSLYVSLISPSGNVNINRTFQCNATSTENMTNVTFYIWNSTNSLVNISNKSVTGLNNVSNFSYNFTAQGVYYWNCLFSTANTRIFSDSNFTVNYDLISPVSNITSPINGSWYNAGRFNISLNESGSCRYSLDGFANISMDSSDNLTFYSVNSSLAVGLHNMSYYCNDSAGNNNNSGRIWFNVELTNPEVNLFAPVNTYSSTGTTSVDFVFNVSDDLNISECNLIMNGLVRASNTNISNQSANQTISYSVSPGSYSWNINCSDIAGNVGNSSTRTMTINSVVSGSVDTGGGGDTGTGGGGAVATTYSPTPAEFSSGYTQELANKEVIKFTIPGNEKENHTLTVDSVGNLSVNITIRSQAVKLTLVVGQVVKLNLTSGEFYDLYVRLDAIADKKAKLTLMAIHEEINPIASSNEENIVSQSPPEQGSGSGERINNEKFDFRGIILIVILIALGILIVERVNNKKKDKDKKKLNRKGKKKSLKENIVNP